MFNDRWIGRERTIQDINTCTHFTFECSGSPGSWMGTISAEVALDSAEVALDSGHSLIISSRTSIATAAESIRANSGLFLNQPDCT